MPAQSEIAISIIVPCFDRLDLLERTVRACFRQQMSHDLGWEILVCDNHPEQLARVRVLALIAEAPVPLRYLPAPARNIARARNVGVAAARGRLIAFVDDDEAPEPGWLAAYYECLERTGADAAFGPKYPVFPDGKPPAWDPEAIYYTTDFKVPADTTIGRTGRWGRALGCGNSCMRVATCLNEPKPFDEDLGRADGEDALLYFRLLRAGRRFVWCPDAVVREAQPASRLTYAYMEARLKRGSRTASRCRMKVSQRPLATHTMLVAAGVAQVIGHGALLLLTGDLFQPLRVAHRLGIARGLGKLTYRGGDTDFIAEHALPASRAA